MPYKPQTIKSTVEDALSAYSDFDDLTSEMGDWRDKMSGTNLENSDKYYRVEEAANALETINSELESSVSDLIENLPDEIRDKSMEYIIWVPPSKKQSPSRSYRCDNACSAIRSGLDVIILWIEETKKLKEIPEGIDLDEIEGYISDIESQLDEADGVDFPGMFG